MITITVNGQVRELEGPMTLPRFIESLGVRAAFLAVAYNGEVLRREEHASVTLKEGDVLELVRPVGGGAAGAAYAPNPSRAPRRPARSCSGDRGGAT